MLPDKRQLYTLINVILLIVFLFSSVFSGFSQPVSTVAITSVSRFSNYSVIDDISFSPDAGIIREIHTSSSNENKKTVILIQDAHCNYEAQKNIYEILETLVNDNNVNLVVHEGAKGYLKLSPFKSKLSRQKKERITDDFMRKGILTASEAFAINNSGENALSIFGAENKELYLKNFKAFHDVIGERIETMRFVDDISKLMDVFKRRLWNSNLKKLSEEEMQFSASNFKLNNEVEWLLSYLAKKEFSSFKDKIFHGASFPNFKRFLDIMTEEDGMNYEKVEEEENLFYLKAKTKLKGFDYDKLMELFLNRATNRISEYQYYKGILKINDNLNFKSDKEYANFIKYAIVKTKYKEIYVSELINEIQKIKEELKNSLCENKIQKELVVFEKKLTVLKKILELKATISDYKFFEKNKSEFSSSNILKFIKTICSKANLDIPFIFTKENSELGKAVESATRFYKFALERDEVLASNLINEMNRLNQQTAILITGGFHTEGITKKFQKQDIEYTVISPTIKNDFSSLKYFKQMNIQKNNVKDILLTIPSNLSGVLLLDEGIFPKEIKIKELNELKMLLNVAELDEESISVVNFDGISEYEHDMLIKNIQILVDKLGAYASSPSNVTLLSLLLKLQFKLYDTRQPVEEGHLAASQKKVDEASEVNVTMGVETAEVKEGFYPDEKMYSDGSIGNFDQLVKPSFAMSSERTIWDAYKLDKLFDKFFSNERSSYSTVVNKSAVLPDFLRFLGIPVPPESGNLNPGEKIMGVLKNMKNGRPFRVTPIYPPGYQERNPVIDGFYIAVNNNESEEVLLSKLRSLLGVTRKEKLLSKIEQFDFNSNNLVSDFSSLVRLVADHIIAKEHDAVRDLNWKYKEKYLENLDWFSKGYKVLQEKEARSFSLDLTNREIAFNAEILDILKEFKRMDLQINFGEGRISYTNLFASYLIGTIQHELRGHFKHNTTSESIAFVEQGSKYSFINFSSTILLLSLKDIRRKGMTPDMEGIINAAKAIMDYYKTAFEIPITLSNQSEYVIGIVRKLAEEYLLIAENDGLKTVNVFSKPVMSIRNRYDFYWEKDPGIVRFNKVHSSGNLPNDETDINKQEAKWMNYFSLNVDQLKLKHSPELYGKLTASAESLNDYLKATGKLPESSDIVSYEAFVESIPNNQLWTIMNLYSKEFEEVFSVLPDNFPELEKLRQVLKQENLKEILFSKFADVFIESYTKIFLKKPDFDVSYLVDFLEFKIQGNSMLYGDKAFQSNLKFSNFLAARSKAIDPDLLINISETILETGVSFSSSVFQDMVKYFFSKHSDEKPSHGLYNVLKNLGILESQIDQIINFFDRNLIGGSEELNNQFHATFSLLLEAVFEIQKNLGNNMTKNQEDLISDGILEALKKRYGLSLDMQNNIKQSVGKTNLASIQGNLSHSDLALLEKLKIQLDLLRSMRGDLKSQLDFSNFKIENDELIMKTKDGEVKFDTDNFISETISEWDNLEISLKGKSKGLISFAGVLSELIAEKEITASFFEAFRALSQEMHKSINVVIDETTPPSVIASTMSFLKMLSKDQKTRKVAIVNDNKAFIEPILEMFGLTNIQVTTSPLNENGGIVIGQGLFFDQLQNEIISKGDKGFFFLDNFKSPEGAMLLSIAFAFGNQKIVEHLKNTGSEIHQNKIVSLWKKLRVFDQNSKSMLDEMPLTKPLLMYLLKQLSNEDITILKAA